MENFNFGCVGADDYLPFKLTKPAVFLKKNSFENFTYKYLIFHFFLNIRVYPDIKI